MSRPLRIDYAGALHHVMNRATRKDPVFDSESACRHFISLLSQLPARFHVKVHAYSIMPTHWHALIETPHANLASAIQFLDGEFARSLNRRREVDGPVWRGRYKNCVVETDEYWRYLYVYVHANRVRAGLSSDLKTSPWCSHNHYSGLLPAPSWLCTDGLLQFFDGPCDYSTHAQGVLSGRVLVPDGFDVDRLWKPNHTGIMEYEAPPPPVTVQQSLQQVQDVTRSTLRELATTQRGPRGNLQGCLACWWALGETLESQGAVAQALGISVAAVGKRAARAERLLKTEDAMLTEWVRRLRKSERLKLASK